MIAASQRISPRENARKCHEFGSKMLYSERSGLGESSQPCQDMLVDITLVGCYKSFFSNRTTTAQSPKWHKHLCSRSKGILSYCMIPKCAPVHGENVANMKQLLDPDSHHDCYGI